MRVRSTWFKNKTKTTKDISSALAFNSWRITKNHLEDLINEGFVIEKEQVFAVITEYLCFLIQCIDRLIYTKLERTQRQEIIILLVKQLAEYYQENKSERISSGDYYQEFINTYNKRSQDYANYEFLDKKPSYHFLRYFAKKIQKAMTKVDSKWIVQQIIEIQAPKAFESINKSVNELTIVEKITSKNIKI